jgi:hypothetical protein
MSPRQLWLFKLGCWVAWAMAAGHVAAVVALPMAAPGVGNGEAVAAAAGVSLTFPDGTLRTLGDLLTGFSLAYALLAAAVGGIGLAAVRRGRGDAALMADIARALAIVCLALLLISLTHFFLVPTLIVAVMLVCFTLAAVRGPG